MSNNNTYTLIQTGPRTVSTLRNGKDKLNNVDLFIQIQSVVPAGNDTFTVTGKDSSGKYQLVLVSVKNGACSPIERRNI